MPRSPTGRLLAACVLAAAAAGLVGPATATTARVRSLGGQADFLEDDANVLRWYGSLVDYPRQAVLELGNFDHRGGGPFTGHLSGEGGGLHVRFDRGGAWGVGAFYFGEDLPSPAAGGWIGLLWARRWGRLDIGAFFLASSFSDVSLAPASGGLHGDSDFLHDAGLGLRWDLAANLYADLAANLTHVEVDYFHAERGVAVVDAGGWDSFGLRGRLWHGITDHVAAIYRLHWYRDLRPLVDPALDDLADLDASTFGAGIGCNVLPDADNLFVVSVDYRRRDDDRRARHPVEARFERGRQEWWRLHVRGGLEARVLPWLTVRAAASYQRTVDESLLTFDWAEDYQERSYDYTVSVATPVVLGLGVHLGPFDADVVLNDTAPYSLDHLPRGGSGHESCDRSDRGTRYTSVTLGLRF